MVSRDIGPIGPLVLIAPIPLLLYAFAAERAWPVAVCALVAGLLGRASLIAAYLTVFPPFILALWAILLPLWFAGIVLASRWLVRGQATWLGLLAYPALTTATEFLLTTLSPHGSFGALGYALTGILPLLQVASVGGVAALTFLAAFIPTLLALTVQAPGRWRETLLPGGVLLAAILTFGFLRLSEGFDGRQRVALAAIDALQDDELSSEPDALNNANAYAATANELAGQRPDVIVLPEKSLIQRVGWTDIGAALQAFADRARIPIVAGLDQTRPDGSHDNVAVVYTAGLPPARYLKRRLIPGLEEDFNPGRESLIIGDRGIAICKDMDFAPMIREYGRKGVRLMLIPAWDFRNDAELHARMALVRGVENGFAVARAAAGGVLSVSDAYGRKTAERTTAADQPVSLVIDVGLRSGRTIYNRIGDAFGWFSVAVLVLLMGCRMRPAGLPRRPRLPAD